MLAAFFVEELFDMLLKRTGLGKRELLLNGFAEWQAGSTLQLQRIAHENLGVGTCKRTDELVSVTDKIFGVFDTTYRKHARLVKQSIYTGVSEVSISGNDSVESTVDLESNNGVNSNSYTDGIDSTLLSEAAETSTTGCPVAMSTQELVTPTTTTLTMMVTKVGFQVQVPEGPT
jgi:hypothetical protein